MGPRSPRLPIGARAIQHLIDRQELSQLPPEERKARQQEMILARKEAAQTLRNRQK